MSEAWYAKTEEYTILFSNSTNFYSDDPEDKIFDIAIKPDYG